ncbi:MAG: hypothetical protein R3F30_00160 [Planctomycetota bacterium]
MRLGLLLCLSFLTTALPAQTVVPAKYAKVEASSYTAYPFGLSGACRLQYLYGDDLFAVPIAPFSTISFRGNGGLAASAKTGVELEILCSTTKVSPWAPNSTFASNHDTTTLTTVFTKKKVNLPAQVATPTPANFVTSFPLDAKYVYIRSNGNLLIDYIVHTGVSGSYSHDTSYTSSAVNTAVGTACTVSMSVAGGTSSNATSQLTYNLSGAPTGSAAVHILGSMALANPIPLPYGGCNLYQDLLLLVPVPVTSSGTATVNYPCTGYRDYEVYGQFLVVDPSGPKLYASQSYKTVIGGLDSHCRIYSTSSATATTGSTQLGVGIVSELK